MRPTRLALALVVALGLLAGGCGGEPADDDAAGGGQATTPPGTTTPGTTEPGTPSPGEEPPVSDGDALAQIDAFIEEQDIDKSSGGWKTDLPKPPQASFEGDKTYYWWLKTNKGGVKVRLLPDVAPMHVSSTIYLTRLGFYDDVVFHRIIPGFMAQGGDPLGRGTGGPGYQYEGEFSASVRHDRPGLLSMANAGPGTDGSQFFLTFAETPWLDGKHTIFGEVVEGMDTLKVMERLGSRSGTPAEEVVIQEASIQVED